MEKTKEFLKSEYDYACKTYERAASDYYYQLDIVQKLKSEYDQQQANTSFYKKTMDDSTVEMEKYATLCTEMGIDITVR